jgi:hypothetical protein
MLSLLAALFVLALAYVVAEDAGTTFAVHGSNIHINTPNSTGSVIIDGSLDVKALAGSINGKVAEVKVLNATLQTVLATNHVQQVRLQNK